ncbi:MAG: hypothetical protein V1780_05565 [Chloroflexota bacterium]
MLPAPKLKPEPAPEKAPEVSPAPEPEPEPEPAAEVQIAPAPDPVQKAEAIELTVEKLIAAYLTDHNAADTRFVHKLLRVTGVVALIDVKERLETHYLRLTGPNRNLLESVQCMFDKRYAEALKQLQIGQTVTVQGEFNGSLIAIRMVNCVLVR